MNRTIVLMGVGVLAGCGVDSTIVAMGDVVQEEGARDAEWELRTAEDFDSHFTAAAAEFGVPAAVLKAAAWVQTRYAVAPSAAHEDEAPRFGLMALSAEQCAQAAAALGVDAARVQQDAATNVRAAAWLWSERAAALKVDRAALSAWGPIAADVAGLTHYDARKEFVHGELFVALTQGVGRIADELLAAGALEPLRGQAQAHAELKQSLTAAPDYPAGIWRESPNSFSRTGDPKLVIIHTCEGSYSSCVNTFLSSAVSAHYVVSTTGEVTQMVRESRTGQHISATYDCKNNSNQMCELNGRGSNGLTIGIEHAGSASQTSFPAAQVGSSAKVVCSVTKRWGIPRDRYHVVGHGQLQPWNRVDPGRNWPWTSYMQQIEAACAPAPQPTQTITIDNDNANNDATKARAEIPTDWLSSTNVKPFNGTGYRYARTASGADATFWFHAAAAGQRTIEGFWPVAGDRHTAARVVALNAAGTVVGEATVNQRAGAGTWNPIGRFAFTAGWNRIILKRGGATANTIVVADAVRVR